MIGRHIQAGIDASSGTNFKIAALRLGAVFCGVALYTLLSTNLMSDENGLIAYTVLLLCYLACEMWKERTDTAGVDWLNPAVLASMFTIVLSFGVSNVIHFLPEELVKLVGVEPMVTSWMNHLMLLVLFASIAMWAGYYSWAGRECGRAVRNSSSMKRWITTSTQLNHPVVYVCLSASFVARLLMIKLGVYGFSSEYGELLAGAVYTQYLSIAESLGQVALLSLAIHCFASSRALLSERCLLFLLLIYEVSFGFLSGFKSQVVTPFIVVGFAYYSQHRRFPRWMVPAVLVGIFVAYAVIEPFRYARNHDVTFDGKDIGNIATTIATARDGIGNSDEETAGTALSILARVSMTYIASKGIEFAATARLPDESPDFLGDIFLAPIHAIVPRLLWEGKPFQNVGVWYTVEVMGYGLDDGILSSTAMSPVTYLNFAGGIIAVSIGFFVIGIFQRILVDGFRSFGGGGLIVFFGLLPTLVMIGSAVNTILVSLIRLIPLLLIAQHFLLKRGQRSTPLAIETV